jgi:hypothetical protein
MLFTSILSLAAMATSALAGYSGSHVSAPTTAEDHPLDQGTHSHNGTHDRFGAKLNRRGAGIYWCTSNNWQNCHKTAADNTCRSWNTGSVGSFGPDQGAKCTVYRSSGCKSNSANIGWPGTGHIGYLIFGANGEVDYPESWMCHT